MKRVVSFFTFFFLLLTLSYASRTESLDLIQVLDHDDHDQEPQIKPSSDVADSSKILQPTESIGVPDDTKSSPIIEEKEAIEELETTPDTTSTTKLDLDLFQLMNRHPVRMDNRFNGYSFPIFRYNPHHGCRQLHHFMRHPRRIVGINELGSAPILEMDLKDDAEVDATKVLQHLHEARNFPEVEGDDLRMFYPRHHHHHHYHHDHDDEDDQRAEMKTEAQEEEEREHEHEEREKEEKHKHKHKHKDHEHGNSKKYLLKKIRKFLGYF